MKPPWMDKVRGVSGRRKDIGLRPDRRLGGMSHSGRITERTLGAYVKIVKEFFLEIRVLILYTQSGLMTKERRYGNQLTTSSELRNPRRCLSVG